MRRTSSLLLCVTFAILAVAPPATNAFSGLPGSLNLLGSSCRRSSASHCVMASSKGWSQSEVDFAAQHTVAELKSMLHSRGMTTTGRKAELLTRLTSAGLAPATHIAPPKPPSLFSAAAVEEAERALQIAGRWTENGATAFLDDTTRQDGQRGSDQSPTSWKLPGSMIPSTEEDTAAFLTRRDARAAARAHVERLQHHAQAEITEEQDRRSHHMLALKQAEDARQEEDARLTAMEHAAALHAAEDR